MQKYFLVLLLGVCFYTTKAQTLLPQTPCSTTNQGTAAGFVINYTIGEMVLVNSVTNNGLFITQGIMQPDVANGIVNYNAFVDGEIKVYPNPTPDELSIQISILKAGKMSLQLTDALGQIILTDQFDVNTFSTKKYNLKKYANATYVLKLMYKSNDGQLDKRGTYKIVKQ
jgi:hypothetical protein